MTKCYSVSMVRRRKKLKKKHGRTEWLIISYEGTREPDAARRICDQVQWETQCSVVHEFCQHAVKLRLERGITAEHQDIQVLDGLKTLEVDQVPSTIGHILPQCYQRWDDTQLFCWEQTSRP